MSECRRVLKNGGLCSFSTHDYKYLTEHYPDCLNGHKFYPYANAEIYWEAFEASDLVQFAKQAVLEVILCEKGYIYKPEDGNILQCLGRKRGGIQIVGALGMCSNLIRINMVRALIDCAPPSNIELTNFHKGLIDRIR